MQALEDAKIFGIELPPKKTKKDKDFVVYQDNWDSVQMFLRGQTQWNVSMSGITGLRYDVFILAGGLFDVYDIEDKKGTLEGLQVMEAAAMSLLNKKDS
tara:strand:+ start:882 stop:1178 length:297 start_codon:yes stop_codon:yes gene_type:complete